MSCAGVSQNLIKSRPKTKPSKCGKKTVIAIVNVGPPSSDPRGWRIYEVRVNTTTVATFKHKRSDGLQKCIERAAKAVKKSDDEALDLLAGLFK